MNPVPTAIKLSKKKRELQLQYQINDTEQQFCLSCEYLRVHSPSAEVRGHGNAILQTGKIDVNINKIETVGNYAIQIYFDDCHDTGIYSWQYLYELCTQQEEKWQQYLTALKEQGGFREADKNIIKFS